MLFRKKDKSGTHYPNRPDRAKAVHPGDYYECEPEELGSAIDTFDRIDGPMPAKGAEAVAIAPAPGPMRIVPRGHGWFDVLDSTGRATIYLTAANYKFVLKTSADVTIWTQDQVSSVAPFNVDLDVAGTAGEAIAAG